MTAEDIQKAIRTNANFYGVYVPEFTFGDMRIDAAIVDTNKREVNGYEIKVSRRDFVGDRKWTNYSMFCTTLAIVCPEGLIEKDEVENPFGLYWVDKNLKMKCVKRNKRIQSKRGLAWLWRYVQVLEKELPRLDGALNTALYNLHERDFLAEAKTLAEHIEKSKDGKRRWSPIDQLCYRVLQTKTKESE